MIFFGFQGSPPPHTELVNAILWDSNYQIYKIFRIYFAHRRFFLILGNYNKKTHWHVLFLFSISSHVIIFFPRECVRAISASCTPCSAWWSTAGGWPAATTRPTSRCGPTTRGSRTTSTARTHWTAPWAGCWRRWPPAPGTLAPHTRTPGTLTPRPPGSGSTSATVGWRRSTRRPCCAVRPTCSSTSASSDSCLVVSR